MLKTGLAKVVSRSPFTIQLLYDSATYTQPITLGIDSGYKKIGFSAVTEVREVISGEVDLLDNVSERITERTANRQNRRTKKTRYRKPRFDNRKRQEGTLAPSIQHKLDSHTRLIEKIQRILPVTKVVVEIGSFDVQKLKKLKEIESSIVPNQEVKQRYSDLIEHSIRIWETLENQREMIEVLNSTNESLINRQLNYIMKTLTVISVIMFPLTLLAAIFGMNAKYMPFVDGPYGFYIILSVMLSLSLLMLIFFYRKKWLK
jgi:Mg2+ and Co2+ transporter CorA